MLHYLMVNHICSLFPLLMFVNAMLWAETGMQTFRILPFRILTFRIPQNCMRNVLILYAKRLLVLVCEMAKDLVCEMT